MLILLKFWSGPCEHLVRIWKKGTMKQMHEVNFLLMVDFLYSVLKRQFVGLICFAEPWGARATSDLG